MNLSLNRVLALHFFLISIIAFGGASAVLPEMHRFLVDDLRLMTDQDFIALNALAQAAPGPNVQIVAMYGFWVASLPGALAFELDAPLEPHLGRRRIGVEREADRHARLLPPLEGAADGIEEGGLEVCDRGHRQVHADRARRAVVPAM